MKRLLYTFYVYEIRIFVKILLKNILETLIQTIKIYSQAKEMEQEIETCTMLIIKKKRREITEGIELPNQERIRILGWLVGWFYGVSTLLGSLTPN